MTTCDDCGKTIPIGSFIPLCCDCSFKKDRPVKKRNHYCMLQYKTIILPIDEKCEKCGWIYPKNQNDKENMLDWPLILDELEKRIEVLEQERVNNKPYVKKRVHCCTDYEYKILPVDYYCPKCTWKYNENIYETCSLKCQVQIDDIEKRLQSHNI